MSQHGFWRGSRAFFILRLIALLSAPIAFAVMLGIAASFKAPGEAHAASVVPDRLNAPSALVVTNTNDSGVGSLRQAIFNANNSPGPDTITFNIPSFTPQVFTIAPLTPLPPIASPVTIDGTTQLGGHQRCHIALGHPCIVLNGSNAGGSANGLTISSPGGSTVRGLVINHFVIGIELGGYGGSHIEGNYIGTNVTGTVAAANGVGIVIDGSSNNIIGGTAAGARNLISGNVNYGVVIGTATGNVVAGNFIGTDINGTSALPNRIGVFMTAASNNVIGGTGAGAGNVIAGNQAGDGVGVWIGGASSTGNVVAGNYIGTDIHGSAQLSNNTGVRIDGSPGNIVGGTTPGARNLVSGNGTGVSIVGGAAVTNTVAGNFIGTNVSGTIALPNGLGVLIEGSSGNTIGGTSPGARNLISGNDMVNSPSLGILISGTMATGNTVEGNYIGTDVTGTGSLPNYSGVQITDASGNTIGGTTAGARNLISGNGGFGVSLVGSTATGNRVQGNYIGTDVNGTASLRNYGLGVEISAARNNVIGGTTVAARNLISGNSIGIRIHGLGASGNRVEGNLIGTNVNGTAALPNGAGVDIFSTSGNTLGGTIAGARNLISGNGFNGVSISDNREEELVQGNYIGTDLTGTAKIPNGRNGVQIESATQVTIGGTAAGAGNLVSGNSGDGVMIEAGSISTTVLGNFIGTDVTGRLRLGNGTGGVGIVGSWQNTIGGTDFGAGNLISGNGGSGLVIQDGNDAAMTNTVQGNIIGLAADGMHPLGNELNGVFVMASDNTIGGATAGARNVISANERGIYISAATGNLVQGNYIGTDVAGSLKRGNVGVGLRIQDSVTNTVRDNVIAGNGAEGIDVPGSNGNVLQGNRIGVLATGDGDLGNGGDGILLEGTSSNNLIGGALNTLGNTIAHNGGNGVTIGGTISDTTVTNTISHNSIYANVLLGIDLGDDGVTANDAGDNDTGPNGLQNLPVLTATLSSSNVIVIQGTLNSMPNTNMTLEFFSNRACDPSGYGEGEGFLGSALITTDAGGNASFDAAFARSLLTGAFAAATATDPSGNTSEFSRCVQVAVLKVYLPLVER